MSASVVKSGKLLVQTEVAGIRSFAERYAILTTASLEWYTDIGMHTLVGGVSLSGATAQLCSSIVASSPFQWDLDWNNEDFLPLCAASADDFVTWIAAFQQTAALVDQNLLQAAANVLSRPAVVSPSLQLNAIYNQPAEPVRSPKEFGLPARQISPVSTKRSGSRDSLAAQHRASARHHAQEVIHARYGSPVAGGGSEQRQAGTGSSRAIEDNSGVQSTAPPAPSSTLPPRGRPITRDTVLWCGPCSVVVTVDLTSAPPPPPPLPSSHASQGEGTGTGKKKKGSSKGRQRGEPPPPPVPGMGSGEGSIPLWAQREGTITKGEGQGQVVLRLQAPPVPAQPGQPFVPVAPPSVYNNCSPVHLPGEQVAELVSASVLPALPAATEVEVIHVACEQIQVEGSESGASEVVLAVPAGSLQAWLAAFEGHTAPVGLTGKHSSSFFASPADSAAEGSAKKVDEEQARTPAQALDFTLSPPSRGHTPPSGGHSRSSTPVGTLSRIPSVRAAGVALAQLAARLDDTVQTVEKQLDGFTQQSSAAAEAERQAEHAPGAPLGAERPGGEGTDVSAEVLARLGLPPGMQLSPALAALIKNAQDNAPGALRPAPVPEAERAMPVVAAAEQLPTRAPSQASSHMQSTTVAAPAPRSVMPTPTPLTRSLAQNSLVQRAMAAAAAAASAAQAPAMHLQAPMPAYPNQLPPVVQELPENEDEDQQSAATRGEDDEQGYQDLSPALRAASPAAQVQQPQPAALQQGRTQVQAQQAAPYMPVMGNRPHNAHLTSPAAALAQKARLLSGGARPTPSKTGAAAGLPGPAQTAAPRASTNSNELLAKLAGILGAPLLASEMSTKTASPVTAPAPPAAASAPSSSPSTTSPPSMPARGSPAGSGAVVASTSPSAVLLRGATVGSPLPSEQVSALLDRRRELASRFPATTAAVSSPPSLPRPSKAGKSAAGSGSPEPYSHDDIFGAQASATSPVARTGPRARATGSSPYLSPATQQAAGPSSPALAPAQAAPVERTTILLDLASPAAVGPRPGSPLLSSPGKSPPSMMVGSPAVAPAGGAGVMAAIASPYKASLPLPPTPWSSQAAVRRFLRAEVAALSEALSSLSRETVGVVVSVPATHMPVKAAGSLAEAMSRLIAAGAVGVPVEDIPPATQEGGAVSPSRLPAPVPAGTLSLPLTSAFFDDLHALEAALTVAGSGYELTGAEALTLLPPVQASALASRGKTASIRLGVDPAEVEAALTRIARVAHGNALFPTLAAAVETRLVPAVPVHPEDEAQGKDGTVGDADALLTSVPAQAAEGEQEQQAPEEKVAQIISSSSAPSVPVHEAQAEVVPMQGAAAIVEASSSGSDVTPAPAGEATAGAATAAQGPSAPAVAGTSTSPRPGPKRAPPRAPGQGYSEEASAQAQAASTLASDPVARLLTTPPTLELAVSHQAALRAFYTDHAPAKATLEHAAAAWGSYGIGMWAALAEKYGVQAVRPYAAAVQVPAELLQPGRFAVEQARVIRLVATASGNATASSEQMPFLYGSSGGVYAGGSEYAVTGEEAVSLLQAAAGQVEDEGQATGFVQAAGVAVGVGSPTSPLSHLDARRTRRASPRPPAVEHSTPLTPAATAAEFTARVEQVKAGAELQHEDGRVSAAHVLPAPAELPQDAAGALPPPPTHATAHAAQGTTTVADSRPPLPVRSNRSRTESIGSVSSIQSTVAQVTAAATPPAAPTPTPAAAAQPSSTRRRRVSTASSSIVPTPAFERLQRILHAPGPLSSFEGPLGAPGSAVEGDVTSAHVQEGEQQSLQAAAPTAAPSSAPVSSVNVTPAVPSVDPVQASLLELAQAAAAVLGVPVPEAFSAPADPSLTAALAAPLDVPDVAAQQSTSSPEAATAKKDTPSSPTGHEAEGAEGSDRTDAGEGEAAAPEMDMSPVLSRIKLEMGFLSDSLRMRAVSRDITEQEGEESEKAVEGSSSDSSEAVGVPASARSKEQETATAPTFTLRMDTTPPPSPKSGMAATEAETDSSEASAGPAEPPALQAELAPEPEPEAEAEAAAAVKEDEPSSKAGDESAGQKPRAVGEEVPLAAAGAAAVVVPVAPDSPSVGPIPSVVCDVVRELVDTVLLALPGAESGNTLEAGPVPDVGRAVDDVSLPAAPPTAETAEDMKQKEEREHVASTVEAEVSPAGPTLQPLSRAEQEVRGPAAVVSPSATLLPPIPAPALSGSEGGLLGCDVIISGEHTADGMPAAGIVRYAGPVQFDTGAQDGGASTQWYGVELDQPIGTCDGSVQGMYYFTCAANKLMGARPATSASLPYAVFVRREGIIRVKEGGLGAASTVFPAIASLPAPSPTTLTVTTMGAASRHASIPAPPSPSPVAGTAPASTPAKHSPGPTVDVDADSAEVNPPSPSSAHSAAPAGEIGASPGPAGREGSNAQPVTGRNAKVGAHASRPRKQQGKLASSGSADVLAQAKALLQNDSAASSSAPGAGETEGAGAGKKPAWNNDVKKTVWGKPDPVREARERLERERAEKERLQAAQAVAAATASARGRRPAILPASSSDIVGQEGNSSIAAPQGSTSNSADSAAGSVVPPAGRLPWKSKTITGRALAAAGVKAGPGKGGHGQRQAQSAREGAGSPVHGDTGSMSRSTSPHSRPSSPSARAASPSSSGRGGSSPPILRVGRAGRKAGTNGRAGSSPVLPSGRRKRGLDPSTSDGNAPILLPTGFSGASLLASPSLKENPTLHGLTFDGRAQATEVGPKAQQSAGAGSPPDVDAEVDPRVLSWLDALGLGHLAQALAEHVALERVQARPGITSVPVGLKDCAKLSAEACQSVCAEAQGSAQDVSTLTHACRALTAVLPPSPPPTPLAQSSPQRLPESGVAVGGIPLDHKLSSLPPLVRAFSLGSRSAPLQVDGAAQRRRASADVVFSSSPLSVDIASASPPRESSPAPRAPTPPALDSQPQNGAAEEGGRTDVEDVAVVPTGEPSSVSPDENRAVDPVIAAAIRRADQALRFASGSKGGKGQRGKAGSAAMPALPADLAAKLFPANSHSVRAESSSSDSIASSKAGRPSSSTASAIPRPSASGASKSKASVVSGSSLMDSLLPYPSLSASALKQPTLPSSYLGQAGRSSAPVPLQASTLGPPITVSVVDDGTGAPGGLRAVLSPQQMDQLLGHAPVTRGEAGRRSSIDLALAASLLNTEGLGPHQDLGLPRPGHSSKSTSPSAGKNPKSPSGLGAAPMLSSYTWKPELAKAAASLRQEKGAAGQATVPGERLAHKMQARRASVTPEEVLQSAQAAIDAALPSLGRDNNSPTAEGAAGTEESPRFLRQELTGRSSPGAADFKPPKPAGPSPRALAAAPLGYQALTHALAAVPSSGYGQRGKSKSPSPREAGSGAGTEPAAKPLGSIASRFKSLSAAAAGVPLPPSIGTSASSSSTAHQHQGPLGSTSFASLAADSQAGAPFSPGILHLPSAAAVAASANRVQEVHALAMLSPSGPADLPGAHAQGTGSASSAAGRDAGRSKENDSPLKPVDLGQAMSASQLRPMLAAAAAADSSVGNTAPAATASPGPVPVPSKDGHVSSPQALPPAATSSSSLFSPRTAAMAPDAPTPDVDESLADWLTGMGLYHIAAPLATHAGVHTLPQLLNLGLSLPETVTSAGPVVQSVAWEAVLRAALGQEGKAAVSKEDLKMLAGGAAKVASKAAQAAASSH